MSDGMSEAFGMSRRLEKKVEEKKYIVFYVIDEEPKVKKFKTLDKAKYFAAQVNKLDNRKYSWVDYIVKGQILMEDK